MRTWWAVGGGGGRPAGRTAVVAGAAGGIGRAVAERCVREGAAAVLFLASDEAAFVTGDVLPIDGGHLAQ
ncbi:hypothetical protein ACPC54_06700 [Kitasatospora sp. NPDC094028]